MALHVLMFCRTVSQQFGIALSTAHDSLTEVIEAVLANMKDLIRMPACMRATSNDFYNFGYPNVVGAIDGTSITVRVPDEHRIDYFTRKYCTAINLTAVCDAKKKFMHINVGQSGRCHDSNIFNNSSLTRAVFTQGMIPNQFHLIGDAAYGLHINIMCPYPGENLPDWKELHNTRHSSTRMVIERALSDLKSRWLRLQSMRCELDFASKIVAACCCLHNICIEYEDIAPSANQRLQGFHNLEFVTAAHKRDAIANHILAAEVFQ